MFTVEEVLQLRRLLQSAQVVGPQNAAGLIRLDEKLQKLQIDLNIETARKVAAESEDSGDPAGE